ASTLCSSVGLDSSGNGACGFNAPSAGSYQIEIAYSGDGRFDPGSGAFTFATAQASVAIGLSGLVSTVPGRSLTLTSSVSSASPMGTPTGTVTFVEHNLSTNGRTTQCGSVPIDPSGNSSCAYTTPP